MLHIAVVSDSHGAEYYTEKFFDRERHADYIFHLGDGPRDLEPHLPTCRSIVCQVAGNCDFIAACPAERELTVGGVSFLLTHGHCYGVKQGLGRLVAEAQSRQIQFALFGHTHEPLYRIHNGVYLLNPGSLGRGDYACIDIDEDAIATVTMKQLY